jgi:hypothetical protein
MVSYFVVVMGLEWLKDPESYASGSVATGGASLAGQVKGDDQDEKGYSGPSGWELDVRLTSPRKNDDVEKTLEMPRGGLIHTCIRKRIWLLVQGTSEQCSKLEQ